MSELDTQQYLHCDGCGRVVPMKPEWAGRRLRCKCGGIVQAPGVATARPAQAKKPAAIPLADAPSSDTPEDAGGDGVAPPSPSQTKRPPRRAAPAAVPGWAGARGGGL